jgi:hypothetical protein
MMSTAMGARMGKHETGYPRVDKDFYPTPDWVIGTLAEHVYLTGLTVWDPACGDGRMAEALRQAGCAHVQTSDIVGYGNGQDEVLDFLSTREPKRSRFDLLVTNPPFGPRGTLAVAFIEAGLKRIRQRGGMLALLLPVDFDSAKSRARYFGDCPEFTAKIVLRRRIVWFQRNDGITEAPKENHAWYIWEPRSLLRVRRPPVTLYAPEVAAPAFRLAELRHEVRQLERGGAA